MSYLPLYACIDYSLLYSIIMWRFEHTVSWKQHINYHIVKETQYGDRSNVSYGSTLSWS